MDSLKDCKIKIALLSQSYIASNRIISDHETFIRRRSYEDIRTSSMIVSHMEDVSSRLAPEERLIIEKEVFQGETGKWYLQYFSTSSYYRYRSKAYRNFLNIIER